jgi:hypothetical protein
MKDFYFQIKGKSGSVDKDYVAFYGRPQNWTFPPIYSGMVSAEDKNSAKSIIDEMYGKKFPLRVLSKDLESNEFLLSVEEIKEGSHRYKLFEKRDCVYCGDSFYVIDKYNDENQFYKGWDYCTDKCKDSHVDERRMEWSDKNNLDGIHSPVVYKITNKITGKCYIGKTTQAFTLRWYQHFFNNKGNKFHSEISNSKLTDWIFEVQEIIDLEENISRKEKESFIFERERYWINHFNSIEDGYNSI